MRSPALARLLSVGLALALSSASGYSMQQAPPAEAAPAPTAEVKRLLDDAGAAATAGQFDKALDAADKALAAAQQATDAVGIAMAQASRAASLARLSRADDALAAWR